MRIIDLDLDDANEAEFARHAVVAREVRQVLDNEPEFFPNKRVHRARLMMVGPTFGGRFLTVPLAETLLEGVWRPATAWDSSADETARYRAAHGPARAR